MENGAVGVCVCVCKRGWCRSAGWVGSIRDVGKKGQQWCGVGQRDSIMVCGDPHRGYAGVYE